MQSAFSVDVETYVDEEVNLRRFRWRLKAVDGMSVPSSHSFATKREAVRDGEIALERARHRGRLRP